MLERNFWAKISREYVFFTASEWQDSNTEGAFIPHHEETCTVVKILSNLPLRASDLHRHTCQCSWQSSYLKALIARFVDRGRIYTVLMLPPVSSSDACFLVDWELRMASNLRVARTAPTCCLPARALPVRRGKDLYWLLSSLFYSLDCPERQTVFVLICCRWCERWAV